MTRHSLPTLTLAFAGLAFTAVGSLAADGWHTDFDDAKKLAEESKKDLLIDFTGSDWCHWCKQLTAEVFDQEAFKKGAPESFVLLELDYPQNKEQPESLKKQNELLRDFYEIRGFPTIMLTDSEGRAYARTGYQKGGAEAYLKHLGELRQVRIKRDAALARAESATGLEKAKALNEVLEIIGDPDLVRKHYAKLKDEIIELDSEDTMGLRAERDFQDKLDGLDIDINNAMRAGSVSTIPGLIDEFVMNERLVGEQKQRALLGKVNFHAQLEEHDESLKVAKRVAAIDPKTESGQAASRLVEQIGAFLSRQSQEGEQKKE